jgi:hypothetical protein
MQGWLENQACGGREAKFTKRDTANLRWGTETVAQTAAERTPAKLKDAKSPAHRNVRHAGTQARS